jgi:nucleoside-diphosphate-sugar epimerase
MRIFITGASGYVGGVITEHLVRAGHELVALARSDQARERVEALGAKAMPGGLGDLDVLRAGAGAADAVVHTAVDYFNAEWAEIERDALRSMLDGLKEGAPFLYTSTSLVYPGIRGATMDEEQPVDPQTPQPFKIAAERQVLDAARVAGTVIRAGLVYGRAGSALLQFMLGSALQQGTVAYIGEGSNEWSSVHVDDLAALYVAVLERRSPGTIVNAGGPEPISMRRIVEAVATAAGARAVSVTCEQAAETLGPVADLITRSSAMDSAKAGRLFGWNPASPDLLAELTAGSYA